MIYTDGTYLISDKDPAELHDFAAKIGLEREHFKGELFGLLKYPNYKLATNSVLGRAINNGAVLISFKALIKIAREAQ